METLVECSNINRKMQEYLVRDHAPLVKRIAHHVSGKLPQSIQLDDLIQAGMIGLLEAVTHYDAEKGASFETYASIRIRGSMLDEVRRNDWVPRSVYRNARLISSAVKTVENRLGREAKDQEIAEQLQLSLEQYHEMLQDSASSHVYGFDELGVTDDVLKSEVSSANEPQANALREDLATRLAAVIGGLPHKERLVLSLYYEQDLNLKEIGNVLDVGESRVSQILSQATLRVKSRLSE